MGSDIRLAMLASGSGTTLAAVVEACRDGRVPGVVPALVITSKAGIRAEAQARRLGVDVMVIDAGQIGAEAADELMVRALGRYGIGLVVLAGYLRKIGPKTISAYKGRLFNTHPGPLPQFGGPGMYGRRVHEAVLGSGLRLTAATIHLVTAEYDEGAIVAAAAVPVRPEDTASTLEERVKVAEKKLLIATLATLAEGL